MFIYGSALLVGTAPWPETVLALTTGTVGTLCLAAAVVGYLRRPATPLERWLLVAAALLLIRPGLTTDLLGLVLLVAVFLMQRQVRVPAPA